MHKYLLIAAGGALGSMARYFVGSTVSDRMGTRFPFGTLFVNLTACIIIGFAATFLARRMDVNPALWYLISVGFIGAFSTFSAFEWETFASMRTGAFFLAALYAFSSLILGLAAVWFGSRLAGDV